MNEDKHQTYFDGYTAKNVSIAVKAAEVLRKKPPVQLMPPIHNYTALVLSLASLGSLTVLCLKTGNKGSFGTYSALFFTYAFSHSALSTTTVSCSTADHSHSGPQSLLQKYRLGTYFSTKVRSYNLGDGSCMHLQSASEMNLQNRKNLKSLGLNVLAFGNVKFSYNGSISRPLIVADSNIGTHIIVSTKNINLDELIDTVMAPEDDVQSEAKDTIKWLSYNFQDDYMNGDDIYNGYFKEDNVFLNSFGAVANTNANTNTKEELL